VLSGVKYRSFTALCATSAARSCSIDRARISGYAETAVKASSNLDWATMVAELEAFREAYGHLRVDEQRRRYPTLADWWAGVRGRLQTLTYDQILSLDNLAFFDRLDQRWLDRYAQLQHFEGTTGHCNVSRHWPGNPTLSRWVYTQRRTAAQNAIAPWRRKLLSDLGFCFELVRKGILANCDEMISRLTRYRECFGYCAVSSTWREDKRLSNWVIQLRSTKKSLPPEIINSLDALGFDWDPLNSKWEKRFRELEAFKAHYGHCRVSRRGVLRNWVGNLRHIKETLSPERICRLNALGFDWAPIDTVWRTRYEDLMEFRRRFGHTNVPATWAENPALGHWVYTLRSRKETQSPEQIAMLEKAGFDWRPHERVWMQYYEELKAFRQRNGHCNVPVEKSALGKWVHKQRMKADKMPPHRKKLLNEIGFSWGKNLRDVWMRNFEELKSFQIKYVRSPALKESPLGAWVSNQRTARRKGNMPSEREKLLDEIGFVWRVYPCR